jgi:hypothetical protein
MNFKFKLFSFYSNQAFGHLYYNLNYYIEVFPTKFTFMKIKSRENFGEFIIFFSEGLNPFIIHRRFKY